MIESLPRYLATRLGDRPDAYLLDGARVMPLTRVEGSDEGTPPAAFPQMPDGLAAIDALASTIAMIERVHGEVSSGLTLGTDALAMEPGREGALAQHMRHIEIRKVSAA